MTRKHKSTKPSNKPALFMRRAPRKLRLDEVTFTVEIEPDDSPVRGHFASGDDELDRQYEDAILKRLARGDTSAWCGVIVHAEWNGFRATDSVWAVSLSEDDSPEKYAQEEGMFEEAMADLDHRIATQWAKLSTLCEPEDPPILGSDLEGIKFR